MVFNYVVIHIETTNNEQGLRKLSRLVAIKTNENFRIMSYFEKEFIREKEQENFCHGMNAFEKWLGATNNLKFVAIDMNDIKYLLSQCVEMNYKSTNREFPKIMNYQFFNLKNEMNYRLKLKWDYTITEYLELYGITCNEKVDKNKRDVYYLTVLLNAYHSDLETNKKILADNTINR